jgi:magnesium chelatase subunit H
MDRALTRTEVTFQNIDNSEIGITDVDHYFEYLGGLTQAVAKRSGTRPQAYLCDTLTPTAKIRSISETVRLETRAKTLNPKWYEGMLRHGYSGVAQIEHHVANTFGWSATAGAVDDWVYDEIARTYVLDEAVLERLRSLNLHAARNLTARLLEAQGRGFWSPDPDIANRLRGILDNLEDQIEGVRASGPPLSQPRRSAVGTAAPDVPAGGPPRR